ncbi:hypothetical protein ACR42D_05825 [Desulfovibrio caledoniensis]
MHFFSGFFKGREIRIETARAPEEAKGRINNGLDSPRRGMFLSALTGYAMGDAVDLEYYSLFWPIPVVAFQGRFAHSSEATTLQGRLRTTWFLKTAFFTIVLLPFLLFMRRPTDGGQWTLHDLAGGFGVLVLYCFMALSIFVMSAVFQQKVANRLRGFLA